MTEEMIWNLVLSAAIGAVSWVLKGYADELQASINMEVI